MSSPLKQNTEVTSYDVAINGSKLSEKDVVVEIRVTKDVNKIPTAKVVIVQDMDATQTEPYTKGDDKLGGANIEIGATITISLGYYEENELVFDGLVVDVGGDDGTGSETSIVLECADKAAKMDRGQKDTEWEKKKDSDIMSEVISRNGLSPKVESTSEEHKKVVQYCSTDWDFVLSRAELNGYVVTVSDGEVEVGPPEMESASVSLKKGTDILKMRVKKDSRKQIKKVEAHAWDPVNQELISDVSDEIEGPAVGNKKGSELADIVGGETIKLHSTVPLSKSYLKSWANARLLKSRMALVQGRIKCHGMAAIKPNTAVEIDGMGEQYNGKFYIGGVTHHFFQGTWVTEMSVGLDDRFHSETKQNVSASGASGLVPSVAGIQIGKVKAMHEDEDGENRIHCTVPVLGSEVGVWCRLATYYAHAEAGNFFMPEVGNEVVIGFLNNDPQYGVILGSVFSPNAHKPPYTPDADNTYKAIVTRSFMKIEWNDVDKECKILTPAGNIMTYSDKDKWITIHDENGNTYEMTPDGISLYTPKDMKFKADGEIVMEATGNITIKSTSDMSQEAMNINLKAKVGYSCKGVTTELNGSGQTTVKGGVVLIN